ncbi:hypothetical protein B0H11DRAFT_2373683 [Mycena galericulata]|nr:hypothetical protein B0H11DRAFT_2373683 [Mycena galericulata]
MRIAHSRSQSRSPSPTPALRRSTRAPAPARHPNVAYEEAARKPQHQTKSDADAERARSRTEQKQPTDIPAPQHLEIVDDEEGTYVVLDPPDIEFFAGIEVGDQVDPRNPNSWQEAMLGPDSDKLSGSPVQPLGGLHRHHTAFTTREKIFTAPSDARYRAPARDISPMAVYYDEYGEYDPYASAFNPQEFVYDSDTFFADNFASSEYYEPYDDHYYAEFTQTTLHSDESRTPDRYGYEYEEAEVSAVAYLSALCRLLTANILTIPFTVLPNESTIYITIELPVSPRDKTICTVESKGTPLLFWVLHRSALRGTTSMGTPPEFPSRYYFLGYFI